MVALLGIFLPQFCKVVYLKSPSFPIILGFPDKLVELLNVSSKVDSMLFALNEDFGKSFYLFPAFPSILLDHTNEFS